MCNEADNTSIDSDDISIISSSGDLLKELGISEKDRLALELRSKKRGCSIEEFSKDLYEALKGHEPCFEDDNSSTCSSSEDDDSSCGDELSPLEIITSEEETLGNSSDELSENSETAIIPEVNHVNAKSHLSGEDNIAGFSSDDLNTEPFIVYTELMIDENNKGDCVFQLVNQSAIEVEVYSNGKTVLPAGVSDKKMELNQCEFTDSINVSHDNKVSRRELTPANCGDLSGFVYNTVETRSLINMTNENVKVEGTDSDDQMYNSALIDEENGKESQDNNSKWPISPFSFISWVKEKFHRNQKCRNHCARNPLMQSSEEGAQFSLEESKMANAAGKHENNSKQSETNKQAQNNLRYTIDNLSVQGSKQFLVQNDDQHIDDHMPRDGSSIRHSLCTEYDNSCIGYSLEDIDVELLARKLSLPGIIPESNV